MGSGRYLASSSARSRTVVPEPVVIRFVITPQRTERLRAPTAVAAPIGPLTAVAVCRIVAVVDEPDRYGFAYGTLPGHTERG